MAPMVVMWSRCLRGCALLMLTASLGACSQLIPGAAEPVAAEVRKPPAPISQLLIEPNQFPPQYPAAVLDDVGMERALQEIDGVQTGSVVTPPGCLPPVLWHSETVAVEGVDSATASRLIVVVTRPAPPVRTRLEQLAGCPSFTVALGENTSTVNATVLPAPPVDADDTYAVEQMVTKPESARTILTFAAQIGDALVTASWLQDPAALGEADTSSLDTLFRAAVVKLRRES